MVLEWLMWESQRKEAGKNYGECSRQRDSVRGKNTASRELLGKSKGRNTEGFT